MKNLSHLLITALFFSFLFSTSVKAQDFDRLSNAKIEEQMIVPNYQFEYIPDFTYQEVAAKIKAMETDMPFELNEKIFAFINYFTVRNREYTKMVLQRQNLYFPLFEETLTDHEMPEDIKFLAIIESGLNPKAKSRVGAMGLWQFMPATGRMYSMNLNRDVDDRMDPELATEGAARYLKSLYRMFGDWELALAAYNCGPGNVRKAIKRSGGKKTFWGVYDYLPKETRSYVPQFQAMMYVLRHTEDHNLFLEQPTYPIAFEKIKFNQELDLEQLATVAGVCVEDLEFLNPSIQNRLVPATNLHMAIRVPKEKAELIAANKEQYAEAVKLTSERSDALRASNSTATPIKSVAVASSTTNSSAGQQQKVIYTVKSGDVLGTIATRNGTTVTKLKTWNNLRSNNIRVGQKLVIYKNQANFENTLAQNSGNAGPAPESYTVQPGDTLWLISKKLNGVTVDQLKKLNNLQSDQIKPGQKLKIS
ncbi:Membrane-bound lytic murein transglycosylase D precursor [Mariniradius saccharolyticus AK6]|uniref:Membrane-bound lytic murein transglycosylase D n=1 Tax=Mariniradius saccharolyticus AK6 TaxID=1239962 RepID=M7Y0A3_9BACT|nr:lytic transglycosylase domain-containing protein [Mariniradius saccharolyticus]EMS34182.1 Membrane-bound lytic murein transglycosylase D precursor [Mariniradius saccharolyticus AK6]